MEKNNNNEMIRSYVREKLDKFNTKMLQNRSISSIKKILRLYTYVIHEKEWNDRGPRWKVVFENIIEEIHDFINPQVLKVIYEEEMERFRAEKEKYKSREGIK